MLIHGNCYEELKKIESKTVDLIITDLPYAVTRNHWDVETLNLDVLWSEWKRIRKDNGVVCLTATQPFASKLIISNPSEYKYDWIWEKQQGTGFLNAKKQPLRNHESILVFYKKQPTYNPQFTWSKPYSILREKDVNYKGSDNYGKQYTNQSISDGRRFPLTVQKFSYDKEKLHPTQKPVALFKYLIETYTNENDLVIDCCAGSGTTGVACTQLNRRWVCIEKDDKYYQIAKNRIYGKENN